MKLQEIQDPERKSEVCAELIATLPEWFGIAEANARYVAEMKTKETFGAFDRGQSMGLIALRYHFSATAEVWWLGVRAGRHRKGIGSGLLRLAKTRARDRGCTAMAVMTMSPRSPNSAYAQTRAFYRSRGFTPFVEFTDPRHGHSLMWMMLRL